MVSEPASGIEAARARLDDLIANADLAFDQRLAAFEALEQLAVTIQEMRTQNAELLESRRSLKEERSRYRDLFETLPDGYLLTDAQGIIREVNETTCKIVGDARDDLVGRPVSALVAEWDQRTFAAQLRRLQGEPMGSVLAVDLQVRDHPFVPVELHGTVGDPESEGERLIRWVMHDRRHDLATRELRDSEGQLRALVESAPVGVLLCDSGGSILYGNVEAERLFGVELSGADLDEYLAIFRPDHRGDVADLMNGALDRGSAGSLRTDLIHADGVNLWVELSVAPFLGQNGVREGVVATISDVTDKRSLESELMQAQKLESLGRLAGGIAHDVNNMLAVLELRLDRLRSRHDDPESRADIDELREVMGRTSGLISDLLSFGRQQRLAPTRVDINAEVEQVGGLLADLLSSNVEIALELTDEPVVALVDSGRFDRILMNLALNARDAMVGGGTITIRTRLEESAPIPVSTTSNRSEATDHRYVRIDVSDTGIGIDPADVPRVFEPYFTTKQPGQGTGFGLATTHGIITQSGGAITVESTAGYGTTFTVWLPVTTASAERPDRERTAPRPSGASPGHRATQTVLVVEDQEALRVLLVEQLQQLGYRTLEAADGDAALELVDDRVDLVLTDVVMPRTSGVDLSRELKRSAPDLPVLFISAQAPEQLEARLPRGEVVLAKPFTSSELAEAVRAKLA